MPPVPRQALLFYVIANNTWLFQPKDPVNKAVEKKPLI